MPLLLQVVLSVLALPQVPAAVEELVGGKWAPEDVLPLNGMPEEVQRLREQMLLQRAAAKAKKEKKRANGKVHAVAGDGAPVAVAWQEKPADAAHTTGDCCTWAAVSLCLSP